MEGCYIKYPDLIKQNIEQFLLSDGVHLNDLKLICTWINYQDDLNFFVSERDKFIPKFLCNVGEIDRGRLICCSPKGGITANLQVLFATMWRLRTPSQMIPRKLLCWLWIWNCHLNCFWEMWLLWIGCKCELNIGVISNTLNK